MSSTAAVLI